MSITRQRVSIVGAGPTGALLAILLRIRGFDVTLYESRADPANSPLESGRSINLALADRGIHALRQAGVFQTIADFMVPMRGRMIHDSHGSDTLQLYGLRPNEVIFSISRHRLNEVLLEVARHKYAVDVRFEHRLVAADFDAATARIHDAKQDLDVTVAMDPLLAADGAGSVMRRQMLAAGLIAVDEATLDHAYKELSIPAAPGRTFALTRDALHIWPRGNFMMIALPNADGSFTATLFLQRHGAVSFDALLSPQAIGDFLATHFPDALQLMPNAVAQFQANPTSLLGTVYARPWHVADKAALIGDAAHAIVPFHGQGMNCCFEDCVEFADCIERHDTWQAAFTDFFAARKPSTDAIAAMALDNYLEMRERVVEPLFRLQQALALELERRHPHRFIPRYSMVMFHHELSYQAASSRGAIQSAILKELTQQVSSLDEVDFSRAQRLIEAALDPV